jgi:Protein of unknown function (DUF3823) N-terminal domain/Domain of unknown function (DUF3823_C)
MKKPLYYIALCLVIAAGTSCSKIDNYPAPSETLTGSTVDEVTGQTLQTEIGGGTRVKLVETSYSADPTPYYFQSMQDGTFNNTKLFAATYKVSVEGPFVPLVQIDSAGNVTSDSSQTIVLKNSATLKFKVQPFLRVVWVGTPVFNADSTVTVQVKISRGTKDPNYQQPITSLNLYVSNTQINDGNNNYDPRYSVIQTFTTTAQSDSLLTNTLTLTTIGGALPAQDVYFRVGTRINAGLDEYNYTTPVNVKRP